MRAEPWFHLISVIDVIHLQTSIYLTWCEVRNVLHTRNNEACVCYDDYRRRHKVR
jgi:hypothetical protein